jgi:hypothetical protein
MNQNKVQVRVPSEERLFSICSIFRSVNRDSYVYVLLELYSSPRLLPHPAGGTNKSGLPPPGKKQLPFLASQHSPDKIPYLEIVISRHFSLSTYSSE